MTYYEELKILIAKYTGNEKELLWNTAINNDLKIEGDDAVDFLGAFLFLAAQIIRTKKGEKTFVYK